MADTTSSEGKENGSDASSLARPSNWRAAKNVITMVQLSQGFKTLRDMVPEGAIVETDRITLQWPLGEGAFAFVNLALLDGKREVAVKTLKPELLASVAELELFFSETQLLRKLRHDHIVEFIGVGGSEAELNAGHLDRLFIVQEYCAGGSLRELVLKQMASGPRKLYSQRDALRWALHVARALQYLHSSKPKVVHRDLKLDNILLTSKSVAGAEAKVCDFGLAALVASKRSSQQLQGKLDTLLATPPSEWDANQRQQSAKLERILTNASSNVSRGLSLPRGPPKAELTAQAGSYSYMAPEVLKGEGYDELADIFSFAMVLYNLMYRVLPSVIIMGGGGDDSDMAMYAWKVASGYRPELSDLTVPAQVNAVIEACWKGPPALRPSAADVVKMLEAVEQQGVCAGAPAAGASQGCSCNLM